MAEEINTKKGINGGTVVLIAMITIFIVIMICMTIGLISGIDRTATTNDIDGYWNSNLTEHSFIFIPKQSIDGLVFTFSIRDKNNQELQKIVKEVGNVKKGQQYTVTLNLSELQDFATLMDANYTQLSVTGGTKKLI